MAPARLHHPAPNPAAEKTARLEARVTAEQKALFEKAAALQGRSLTDFVVTSAQERAMHTVREHELMTLSARDTQVFVAALLDAPEPAERLRQAVNRYKNRSRV
jgi:uncharacterized protein (DUF1778 family)